MRRIAVVAAALLLGAAGTGAAFGFGGTAQAVKRSHGAVVGDRGAYADLVTLVTAAPVDAALPSEVSAPLREVVADLAHGASLRCERIDHLLRRPQEHPAYMVVSAVCDRDGERARLVNVLLFPTGRAAVLPMGEVTVEDGPEGPRLFAF